ncbi:MAG: apolipoprotein A1/A4/E family protein [Betaproteobacteria bacterium]|nr:apolipoprotein A1/A4/E family protein [Betaproteobacteria bacterium]
MNMAPTQMNIPNKRPDATAPKRRSRSPWFTVTLTVWLLFLTVIVAGSVIDYRRARQAWGDVAQNPEPLGMSVLTERVEEMATRLQTETSSLRESMQSGLDSVRQALEDRAVAVSELTGQITESAGALNALKDRVNALEARLANERQTVITPNPQPAQPQPAVRPLPSIKPPFQVIGIEQRGFERFLTVMRQGSQSVADIQLLRVGTRFGQWFLEGIEEEHAVFRVEDAIVRLPIPRLPVVGGGA